jgi:glutamine---fructose-6-phosphate transaminase (isomerizing)
MCGIFGYVGQPADVGHMVLGALKRLEYRGYDSWGVAIRENSHVAVQKRVGKIGDALVTLPPAGIGFGHTRWATHGGVTENNAHPHLDCTGRLALIHNGIIENFRELRDELRARGHRFASDTDSEVMVHLVEEQVAADVSLPDAVRAAFARLQGLNAVIVMDVTGNELVAVKTISPLVLGLGCGANYVASDTTAIVDYTRDVVYLDDNQLAIVRPDEVTLLDLQTGAPLPLRRERVDWDAGDIGLHDYPDFMSKEMAEQGPVVHRIATQYGQHARALADLIWNSYGAFLVGCGTASYAALTGMYLFSRIARRHVNAVLGSEFKYQEHFLTDRSLALALSQSGETADIIEAMVTSRARGAKIAALVNVRGSTLDRMADFSVPLGAGPEQCVLSTKAYTAKLAILLLTAHTLAGTPEVGRDILLRAARGRRADRRGRPSLRDRSRPELSDRTGSGAEDQRSQLRPCRRVRGRRVEAWRHRPDCAGHPLSRLRPQRRDARRHPLRRDGDEVARWVHYRCGPSERPRLRRPPAGGGRWRCRANRQRAAGATARLSPGATARL